jgi:hypothetical protein
MREAKQIEARLLEEVGAGRHKGSRSRTMDRYILAALGKLPVRQVDAATLGAFYAHLRTRGGKVGRPLKASFVGPLRAK